MAPERSVGRMDVVGGGAAGLVAALTVQKRCPGVDIHVHEREPEAYTTLCGEGVRVATLERFAAFDSMRFAAQRFAGARWRFPGDVSVLVDDPCVTIERSEWIPAMASALEARGGHMHHGQKITPEAALEMARRTDLLVGADGPGSQVRKAIGGEIDVCLGLQYRIEGAYATDRLEFVTDKRFSPEYAWVFPKGDILNVGVLGANDGGDWARLDRFVESAGVEGKVVKKEAYPIGFNGRVYQSGRIVLVGDAAGLTNPLTKGGIAALIHAADVLAGAVADGRPDEYADRIAAHPIADPRYQRALEVLQRWTNEDFERLARVAPHEIRTNGAAIGRKLLLAWGLAAHPRMARDLWSLYSALGLSREHSW